MDAKKIVLKVLGLIALVAIMFAAVSPVLAQSDPNLPRWDDPAWVAQFVNGSVNAVFSKAYPLPTVDQLPQAVKDALTHGGFAVLVEPWRVGCPVPLTDPNCNVGYNRSFTDWNMLYDATYGTVEANPGNQGPWTDGSVHITYIREMTPDVMKDEDWAAYANGQLKVDFAENKPLPEVDPTNGAVAHLLVEPWRHSCVGLTTDADCNVGKSGTFQTWKEMKDYLSNGQWTRGSIRSMPLTTATGGNLPEVGSQANPTDPANSGGIITLEQAKATCGEAGVQAYSSETGEFNCQIVWGGLDFTSIKNWFAGLKLPTIPGLDWALVGTIMAIAIAIFALVMGFISTHGWWRVLGIVASALAIALASAFGWIGWLILLGVCLYLLDRHNAWARKAWKNRKIFRKDAKPKKVAASTRTAAQRSASAKKAAATRKAKKAANP